jgi:hypothetical protein
MTEDEFITVRLPKEDYEILKEMIKEREAYSYLISKIKNLWVWTVVGGLVSIVVFWESIKPMFIKV